MPRTKLKKATNKRRISTTEEKYNAFCADLEKEMHMALAEYENFLEQKFSRIHNHIKNMRSKMPDHILSMNFGEMQELLEKHNVKTYDQLNELSAKNNAPVAEVPNNRSNATFSNRSARPVSRTDDGYGTNDSVTSDVSKTGRPVGPFQSAKAKSRRRSRSVSSALNQSAAIRSQPIINRNVNQLATHRTSRARFRTPLGSRIQALSADRGTGPVTPKVSAGQTVSLLRYAKQGETVISLGGSPVIAPGSMGDGAMINIPVGHGIFRVEPSNDGVVDPGIISQIDMKTLEQLRQLQNNLDLIMQVATDSGNFQ